MAEEINAIEGKKEAYRGDYICPTCGAKVIGGDHTEKECKWVKRLKEVLASSGHIIQAC